MCGRVANFARWKFHFSKIISRDSYRTSYASAAVSSKKIEKCSQNDVKKTCKNINGKLNSTFHVLAGLLGQLLSSWDWIFVEPLQLDTSSSSAKMLCSPMLAPDSISTLYMEAESCWGVEQMFILTCSCLVCCWGAKRLIQVWEWRGLRRFLQPWLWAKGTEEAKFAHDEA